MPKLNIVIVNDFDYPNGGAGQVALSSALALAEKEHSVILFSAVGSPISNRQNNNMRVICTGQYDILRHPSRMRAVWQGLWNTKAARMMAELLDSLDPSNTIVHIHSWTKALSSSVIRVAVCKGFETICTLHDYFSACPNGGFFNYPQESICRLRPLSGQCLLTNCDLRSYPQKLWRVARQITQRYYGCVPSSIGHFIAVSKFSRTILEPFLPSDAEIHFIRNPIEVPRENPVNVFGNSAFTMVGRLTMEKGSTLFAKAASILGCEAVFIGEGESWRDVIEIYPLAKTTGWLMRSGVIKHLQSARALVFPSLCYETQGLVVLEAAALGVPVIVSDTSAARDTVINGVTGLWFKGGDEVDLSHKMEVLMDPEVAQRMGLAAYNYYWSDPITMDYHIKELEEVYRQILSS